ncbi:MAG: hypothetical protein LBH60_08775, partial [Prevotellaceae bacterium]|nr:hypothetical protein [Prevotellaceae bacterium]
MKTKFKIIGIMVIAFITVSCTALKNVAGEKESADSKKTSSIEGVWKLLYSNLLDENSPEKLIRYKVIVDGRFFWYQVNEENENIIPSAGAGGTYILYNQDNINSPYQEHLEHVFPQMDGFQGREINGSYSISGNIMKTRGSVAGNETTFEEVFEKVSVENKKSDGIQGVWKLLNTDLATVSQHVILYKMIVDDWFICYEVEEDGTISPTNGTGGTLEMQDSICFETVLHVLPYKEEWQNSQTQYEYKISEFETGDILRTNNTNNSTGETYTEIFERIVNLNNPHKSIQDFRRNLYS